jgi:hypothetical protein
MHDVTLLERPTFDVDWKRSFRSAGLRSSGARAIVG